jgi:hypothetical protein
VTPPPHTTAQRHRLPRSSYRAAVQLLKQETRLHDAPGEAPPTRRRRCGSPQSRLRSVRRTVSCPVRDEWGVACNVGASDRPHRAKVTVVDGSDSAVTATCTASTTSPTLAASTWRRARLASFCTALPSLAEHAYGSVRCERKCLIVAIPHGSFGSSCLGTWQALQTPDPDLCRPCIAARPAWSVSLGADRSVSGADEVGDPDGAKDRLARG